MTKRDYKRLVVALRAYRKCNWLPVEEAYEDLVDQIALACQDCAAGAPFDYAKFVDACYKES